MSFTIRASSTPTWADCPRRGAARIAPEVLADAGYTVKQTVSPVGASIGTATHSAIAYMMDHKIITGELANGTETEQVGLESLADNLSRGVRFDQTSPNPNTAQKQVIRMYRTHRLHLAPTIEPRHVERRITVDTVRGNILSGAMDIEDGGIRDTKTGIQRVNIAQYGTYALLRASEGAGAKHLTEDFIQRVSIEKEQPEPVQISYNVEFAKKVAGSVIRDIENRMEAFAVSRDPLVFLANPASQLCSERYCPMFKTRWCPESWGKE